METNYRNHFSALNRTVKAVLLTVGLAGIVLSISGCNGTTFGHRGYYVIDLNKEIEEIRNSKLPIPPGIITPEGYFPDGKPENKVNK
jgi:hypothetical protein